MPYVERVTKAGNTIEIERYFTSRYKKKGISRGDKVKPTKEEQEKVNTRQAERKLRILINANYGYGDYHLVLDYIRRKGEPDRTPEQMRQDIDVFLRECRKEYRKAGLEFKYIHVMEIGKKGARHHHLVVNKIDTEILQRCWYKAYEGHNRVKVFPLDDSGNYAELASYLIKYTGTHKKGTDGALQGKRWNCSKNLVRPEPEYHIISDREYFKKEPKAIKGYYVDKNSVSMGVHSPEYYGYEPKERQIMALPFYDRVVQHAINNVLEPIFDKRFISQSYACRKGKGMHAASDTLKEWLYEWNKYHPDQPLYAIKADIHHYFQSIDHAVLKTEIRKVIKDAGVLALLDRIIDHNGNMPDGVGIPVGNLTSQLFANIYLDALDQFIKHELGVEAYIRYMDDFVILSPDKEQLRNWLARIEQFLREELKLEFNPKTTILAAKNGIDFVGYKHRATHRKVRKDSIKRIKRTIKKCESGKITKEQLQKSIQSWTGHAGHADSYNLRKKIETLAEAAIEKAA